MNADERLLRDEWGYSFVVAFGFALATSWGVDCRDDGKTVWFELGHGEERPVRSPAPTTTAPHHGAESAALAVHLLGASPPLIEATIEHGNALLRELALLSLGGELDDTLPEGWQLPQFDVSPILAAAEAAAATGQTKADIELVLPAGAHAAATERLALVDHADALAREGRLLSAPALPRGCGVPALDLHSGRGAGRRFLAAVVGTASAARTGPRRRGLAADELERLGRESAATVVADDANRIIFVNEAAGEVLGWVPEALVGQRVTVLIPPELREAHLAGFRRLQVTGEQRILGKTLHLPAQRRDGSRVEVAIIIEQLARRGGRSTFRAVLAPTSDAGTNRVRPP